MGFTQARIVAELEQLTGAVGNAWVNSDSGSPASGDSAPMPESWQSEGNEAQSQSVREIVAQAIPDDTETWDVVSVSNSDTIRAQRRGQEGRLRFAYIDVPESDQPLGAESKQRLQQMIDQTGGQVDLLVTDTDRYGRLIADVYAGKKFTQAVLVSEGLAWSYRQFHRNCPSADLINQVEAEAKAAGVGVFGGGHMEPWEWRRR